MENTTDASGVQRGHSAGRPLQAEPDGELRIAATRGSNVAELRRRSDEAEVATKIAKDKEADAKRHEENLSK